MEACNFYGIMTFYYYYYFGVIRYSYYKIDGDESLHNNNNRQISEYGMRGGEENATIQLRNLNVLLINTFISKTKKTDYSLKFTAHSCTRCYGLPICERIGR